MTTVGLTPAEAAAKIVESLPRLQAFAEARMRWTCRVERPKAADAPWDIDPDGYEVPPSPTVIYRGPFRIRSFRPHESTPDVGGATVTVVRKDAHLPAVERIPILVAAQLVEADLAAQPFREGDVIVRVVNGQDVDRYRVASSFETTDQTAQRLLIDEGI